LIFNRIDAALPFYGIDQRTDRDRASDMKISASTNVIALFGDPVSHSLSPLIHNTAFDALGLDYAYLAFHVKPGGLGSAVSALRSLGFRGANLTIPHKQDVVFFLDGLSREAESVGAVNTIVRREDAETDEVRLVGENTDIPGFLRSLEPWTDQLRGKEALVWGAGGAARAAVYGLLHGLDTGRVHLVCRAAEKGDALARDLDESGERVTVVKWDYATIAMQKSTLLVNATPLGLATQSEHTPCMHPHLLREDQVVFDLVYGPRRTPLLAQAEAAGATCVDGLEMLIHQAADAFEAWTGREFPIDEVRKTLSNTLREAIS
jgi:shikimate dehydrogenase